MSPAETAINGQALKRSTRQRQHLSPYEPTRSRRATPIFESAMP